MMRFTPSSCAAERSGFSLLEIVLAVTISGMFAMTGLAFLRNHGETARSRACEGTRVTLQRDVELYQSETGREPGRSLRELATADYAGTGRDGAELPLCPSTRRSYTLDDGEIACPTHGK